MPGFDVNRFVHSRGPTWARLEQLLLEVERHGVAGMHLATTRELGRLYREASDDLMRARAEMTSATLIDYLNDIVGRAYAVVHVQPSRLKLGRVLWFLTATFPRTVRRERRAIALSTTLFLLGAALGAICVATDPTSLGALLPEDHQQHTPEERIRREAAAGGRIDSDEAAAFSGYLFTHNIQVTFLVFALGITFGLGSAALLFYNGIPLGALAAQYHMVGQGLFFWAWILPHGVPELTVVVIGGAAGLILARGQWRPGRSSRLAAVTREARTAVALVAGGAPLLVLAGLIEATISQMHAPAIAYETKLAFAATVALLLFGYLLLAGRGQAGAGVLVTPSQADADVPPASGTRLTRRCHASRRSSE